MPLSQIVSASIEDGAVAPVDLSSVAQYTGFKNRIINGAVGISQRVAVNTAVAVSNGAGGTFGPDRWWGYTGTLSLWNQYQVTTGAYDFPYAWRVQRIAGQTSTSFIYYGQTIETNNCIDLAGQTVTISFYATAGANYSGGAANVQLLTGTVADQGTSSLNSGTWTGFATPISQTFTPTTTRTRFTFTGTIGSTVQEISFRFYWGGSGTAGANDYIDITGVQLEKGVTATSFDYRPYGTELAMCQRYYESNNTAVGGTSVSFIVNTAGYFPSRGFVVTKRATPTMTITPTAGSGAAVSADPTGFYQSTANSAAAGSYWTASAEL